MGNRPGGKSDLILLDRQDDLQALTPRIVLMPQSLDGATDEFMLQAIADGLKSSGDKRMQVVDALCAIVAERAIALKTIETKQALDMLLPTAGLIQRGMSDRTGVSSKEIKPFDMALYELYQELLSSADSMERMRIGFALGDRATHFTGGWVGSRNLSRVMSKEEQVRYGTSMAARGYGSAESVAKTKPTHPEARVVAQTVPGIRRNFRNIVKVMESLGDGDVKELDDVRGMMN